MTSLGSSSASLSVHLRILRWCGFICLPSTRSPPPPLYRAYYPYSLLVTSLYFIQEIIYAYQARGDMERLSRVMFLLLCHLTTLVKRLVLQADLLRLHHLLDTLDGIKYREAERGGKFAVELLNDRERWARHFVLLYTGTALFTCTLWCVLPTVQHLHGNIVEFPFWMPIDYNTNTIRFAGVLVYSYYVTSLFGIANTTMDAMVGALLHQCQAQLRILRKNFENLPEKALQHVQQAGLVQQNNYEMMVQKYFCDLLADYRTTIHITSSLEEIFGSAILVQFLVSGWIICLSVYKIVSINTLGAELAAMILFLACILVELFIYCYYGNEVCIESSELCGSIYNMNWMRVSLGLRRSLVLVMERAKRPLVPKAGRVIPLSLETFLKIIKSSYSFYAVLRQTK